MKGRYGHYLGFNFRISVDTESHMVTEYLLTNHQNDKCLLSSMVAGSEDVTGQKPEEVQADAGYYKATEVEEIEKAGTECYVAVNETPSKINDGENGLGFIYDKEKDHYVCSQGRILGYSRKKQSRDMKKGFINQRTAAAAPYWIYALNRVPKTETEPIPETTTRNG